MIVLSHNATFEAPVMISIIGVEKEVETVFTFKALTRRQMESFLILSRGLNRGVFRYWLERAKLCWRTKRIARLVDMIDEIVAGWDGFDEVYSKESMLKLLSVSPDSWLNIFNAFLQHHEKARIKN